MGLESNLSLKQIEGVICKVVGISKEDFFLKSEISSRYIYEIQQIFYKMKDGSSEEYLLETANFYGRNFYVDDRVLIPRNDTELLVGTALKQLHSKADVKNMVYVDVWTGSSCIAVSMVLEMHPLKFSKSIALDISPEALKVWEKNITELAGGLIEVYESDLLSAIFHDDSLAWKDLCVTANLPYIKNEDYTNMDTKVIENEPGIALYGWEKTWFELYEKLIKQCFQMKQVHKLWNIFMFIEIGFDQKDISSSFLRELWLSFEYFTDSSNIERVISITGF